MAVYVILLNIFKKKGIKMKTFKNTAKGHAKWLNEKNTDMKECIYDKYMYNE